MFLRKTEFPKNCIKLTKVFICFRKKPIKRRIEIQVHFNNKQEFCWKNVQTHLGSICTFQKYSSMYGWLISFSNFSLCLRKLLVSLTYQLFQFFSVLGKLLVSLPVLKSPSFVNPQTRCLSCEICLMKSYVHVPSQNGKSLEKFQRFDKSVYLFWEET